VSKENKGQKGKVGDSKSLFPGRKADTRGKKALGEGVEKVKEL